MKSPRSGAIHRHLLVRIRQLGTGGVLRHDFFRSLKDFMLHGGKRKNEIHPFDVKYGTDTSGIVQPWDLGLPADSVLHAVQYGTAMVDVFTDLLRNLPIRYEDFVFIDLGSGKGRALLLASFFPFKKIIGVELSRSMHEIARGNIQLFADQGQQCFDIESICDDAGTYALPNENIVFYLFNPFDEQIMRAVLSNIERSLQQLPRTIYIAYLKPAHRAVFDQSAFLHVRKETERYVLYESMGLSNASGAIAAAPRSQSVV